MSLNRKRWHGIAFRGVDRLRVRDLYSRVSDVASSYRVTVEDIVGRRRHADLVVARRAVVRVLAEDGIAAAEIGRLLDRDHTTILHYLGRLGARVEDA